MRKLELGVILICMGALYAWAGYTLSEKEDPRPERMMCITLNYEKGGFLKTMVWDSHNMTITSEGKVQSPEGVYNTFPGELCLIAPLTNSRGPKP